MTENPRQSLAINTSKLQLELSHRFLSNSTFESLHRSNFIPYSPEGQSESISRRLKTNRHPLSGISAILPEMTQNYTSDPDLFIKEVKSAHKLNSRILETWLNNTIADASDLNLPEMIVKNEAKVPLVRYGIDRTTLLNAGLQTNDVDRIYRSLFVYSIGFFQLIRKILEHTTKRYTIVTGLWKVYAILLEYCCQFDYEMIITTLNIEKKEEMDNMEKEYKEQIAKNDEHQRQMLDNITLSRQQLQQVQKDLMEEIRKREELEDELLQRGSGHEEEVTMRLQFESKLNQMYAKLRDLESKLSLMLENMEDVQKTSEERTEELHTERKKNLQLVQFKLEIELEVKKTREKSKQLENLNTNLEQRLVECYSKIEELNVSLSNNSTLYNQNLNDLAQKKLELDDVKFTLEICKGQLNKLGAIIEEHKTEKSIHLTRIKYLESTLEDEINNNKHFEQEYVKMKESDVVKTADLEKYRTRCEEQEKAAVQLEQERDTLRIQNQSLISANAEFKEQLKQSQNKLEEMNKGRRAVEEANETLKSRIKDREREIQEARTQINAIKEDQEKMRNNEIELEASMATVNVKLHSIEKQFESTKGTMQDKITNLTEILESEKNVRQNWIYRYEEEQKVLASITKEFISTQDKLNDSVIKNNNLTASLNENSLMLTKITEKYNQEVEENLALRAQNEELVRKNRTAKYLLEKVDEDYKEKDLEMEKERILSTQAKFEENCRGLVWAEEIWMQARLNFEECERLQAELDSRQEFFDSVNERMDELRKRLEEKSEESEGKSFLLEESREFIMGQIKEIQGHKYTIRSLEIDVKKAIKDHTDFRSLAPPELRNTPNPFRVLVKQLADLKGTLSFIETNKPVTEDFEMQYNVPLPRSLEVSIQTDPIKSAKSSRENPLQRRNSSGSSSVSEPPIQDHPVRKKVSESVDYTNLKPINNFKQTERSRKKGENFMAEEEMFSPVNMRSIYNNEVTAESLETSQYVPGRLPLIGKKNIQPSSLVHLPQPIPAAAEFKRYLKQAVSRKKHEKSEFGPIL